MFSRICLSLHAGGARPAEPEEPEGEGKASTTKWARHAGLWLNFSCIRDLQPTQEGQAPC